MSPVLMHIPVARVREYWPMIRAHVEELSKAPGEDWLPEDVFHELLLGGTHLFTTTDVRGFIVTQVLSNPYSRKLHVWLANNVGDCWSRDFFEQIKDIARSNDCKTITFVRGKPGGGSIAPGVHAQTLYSVDVGE